MFFIGKLCVKMMEYKSLLHPSSTPKKQINMIVEKKTYWNDYVNFNMNNKLIFYLFLLS